MSRLRSARARARPQLLAAAVALCAAAPGCGSDAGNQPASTGDASAGPASALPDSASPTSDSSAPATCVWNEDVLLESAGVPSTQRVYCNQSGPFADQLACFRDAMASGQSVELTINNCIDCSILSTFVFTPAGKFRIYREADIYGDQYREVRLESCTDFTNTGDAPAQSPSCAGASTLYSCIEPLR